MSVIDIVLISMWEEIRNLRKTKIGGYNKKSVIDYIKRIAIEFTEYKVTTETAIIRLDEKISKLTGQAISQESVEEQREFSVDEMIKSKNKVMRMIVQMNEKLDLIQQQINDSDKIEEQDDTQILAQMINQQQLEQASLEMENSIDAFFSELEKEEDFFNE